MIKKSLLVLTVLAWSAAHGRAADAWDVLKSETIDAMLARTQHSADVLVKPNVAIEFRVNSGAHAPWQIHPEADEFWFVRRGSAKLLLGEFTGATRVGPPGPPVDVAAGDLVKVPRDKAYQIAPGAGRFEYVAVRIFSAERHEKAGNSPPRMMPTVVTRSQLDNTFATAEANTPLESSGAVLLNQIMFWVKNPVGPYEVHLSCDDFYFKRAGTAKMEIDGTLVQPQENPSGEIRAPGVKGSRVYDVGPGDMISVPRNTAHRMDAGSGKLGYILVKVCE